MTNYICGVNAIHEIYGSQPVLVLSGTEGSGIAIGIRENAEEVRVVFLLARAELGDFWSQALRPVRDVVGRIHDWFRGGNRLMRVWRSFWRFTG